MNYYACIVIEEMNKRGYKVSDKAMDNYKSYFKNTPHFLYTKDFHPFKRHHTKQYLLQNFMNLEEKFERNQRDFDRETYLKLWNFVNDELNGLLEEIGLYLKGE